MNSKLTVFALIQGSILGTRDTDDHGNPWTRLSANAYCQRENNLTAFRRSRNMPGPHFTFVVHRSPP